MAKDIKVASVLLLVFVFVIQKTDSQSTYVDLLQKSFNLLQNHDTHSEDYKSSISFTHRVASKLEKNVYHLMKNPAFLKNGIGRDGANILGEENIDLEEEVSQYNISEKCIKQLFYLVIHYNSTAFLQMLDSDFKPAAGIERLAFLWLGDFDECVNVSVNDRRQNGTHFNGKYCTAAVGKKTNATQPAPNAALFPAFGPVLGLCLPDGCSEADVASIIDAAIYIIGEAENITTTKAQCQDTNKPLSDRAIVSIVFLSILCVLLVVATGYDIFLTSFPDHLTKEETTPLLKANSNGEENVKIVKYKKGLLTGLLLSFSIYTNGKKLLSTHQGNTSLRAVHGIRFLSMSWVILGHTLIIALGISGNVLGLLSWMQRWTFQAIMNGTFSVDTFFTISGLLLTYLTMNELQNTCGKLNWFIFYFHRYWRLTPPLALVMLLYIPLMEYWSDGPLWLQHGMEQNYCESSWWRNLLYIQNFFSSEKMCMAWTWYLANDMQFFFISPIIILPLFMFPLVGYMVFGLFLFGTVLTTGLISRLNHLSANLLGNENNNGFSDLIYDKPWCRIGAYLIGMFTGYILHKTQLSYRLKWYTNLLGWVIATAVALVVLYGMTDVYRGTVVLSYDEAAFYNTLSRPAWAAAVSWLIFACCTGNGGFINTILSWEAFIPLSRLTYMAYIIHPVIMAVVYYSRRTVFYVTEIDYVITFLGIMFITYMVSFVLTLAFESPMIGLERVFLKREKRN